MNLTFPHTDNFKYRYIRLSSVFVLVSCLAYFSTLKIEAKYFSETLLNSQRTTLQHPSTFIFLIYMGTNILSRPFDQEGK
jgi:hypothetical protein